MSLAGAVDGHAEVVGGGLGRPFFLVVEAVLLAGVDHEVDGCYRLVERVLGADGARTADAEAVLHERRGLPALLRCDEVERAKLVVVSPASPIAERFEVAEHFLFGGQLARGHGEPPLVAVAASIPKMPTRQTPPHSASPVHPHPPRNRGDLSQGARWATPSERCFDGKDKDTTDCTAPPQNDGRHPTRTHAACAATSPRGRGGQRRPRDASTPLRSAQHDKATLHHPSAERRASLTRTGQHVIDRLPRPSP